jgi:hypothetical protein
MRAFARHFVSWLFVLAFAAPVAGMDCDFPGNLVPNCGFDVDEAGWFMGADSITGETSDCTTGPRCVTLDRADAVHSIEVMSACIDVNPSTYFTFGGWLRRVSGVITQSCSLSLYEYTDKVCGPGLFPAFFVRAPSASWGELRAGHQVGGTTLSVKLRLACGDENNDFVVRIDDFFVQIAAFTDGFESGDRSFWSVSVP